MKKIEDLLADPLFVRWVNHPTDDLDAYWKTWREAHPEQLSNLKLARELLLSIKYKELELRAGAKQRILNNIMHNRRASPAIPADRHEKYLRSQVNFWDKTSQFRRIAAILLVSFSYVWLTFPHKKQARQELLAEEIPKIQKSTAAGEKLQFTLPDGSRIWLNSVSDLEFPREFDSLERGVILNGEAFFEVEKDSLRPFKVITNGTVTTALGTSFNINGKLADGVRISLLTGKVKVKATAVSEDVFLDPGQELRYDREREKITVNGFNSAEVTAWREGKIIFNDASLNEVVKVLEDWYGVEIQLKNQQGVNWKYSGEYHQQTLENVLNSLSYIQKFKYTINGKKVAFKF